MSIAISEEHRALAQTVAGLLTKHQSRAAARGLLDAGTEPLPAFWAELGGLGLLGLHVPEELGGSGFGLAETLVVAEQMGRHLAGRTAVRHDPISRRRYPDRALWPRRCDERSGDRPA